MTSPPWPCLRASRSVIRSSAPEEDTTAHSFAGLHASYVNIRGAQAIGRHIRLVWASLWSDAALLYRRELGLDVRKSRMAVIVQAMALGECSGVAFSRNPLTGFNEVVYTGPDGEFWRCDFDGSDHRKWQGTDVP